MYVAGTKDQVRLPQYRKRTRASSLGQNKPIYLHVVPLVRL